jgi:hypothetical protein
MFYAEMQDFGATLTAGRSCEAASEVRAVGGAALTPRYCMPARTMPLFVL